MKKTDILVWILAIVLFVAGTLVLLSCSNSLVRYNKTHHPRQEVGR